VVRSRYERSVEFAALVERLDPGGVFRNDFVETSIFGSPA
jgi:hypothetical protein